MLRAPLGTSARIFPRVIGLVGIAALAISPLALTLPARATPVATAASAPVAASPQAGRPDPSYTPAQRKAAIAEAKQDRSATADKLRLG